MTPPLLLTMPGFDGAVESGRAGLEVVAVDPVRFANGCAVRLSRTATVVESR